VDALELKVTMDSPGFATVSALEALEEVVSKIAGSTNAKDMERKLETLSAANKSLDLCLNDVKSREEGLLADLKALKVEVGGVQNISSVQEEIKSIQTKLNQQKTKVVDVEASLNFQERTLDKLGEDVKKINGSVFGSMSSVEDQLAKLEAARSELITKLASLAKRTDTLATDLEDVKTGRSRTENKIAQIDSKVNQQEIDNLQSLVTEEVNKVKKELKEIHSAVESAVSATRTELKDIHGNLNSSTSTTKAELQDMKVSLRDSRDTTRLEIQDLKNSSRAEMEALKSTSKAEMAQLSTASNSSGSITELKAFVQELEKKYLTSKDEQGSQVEAVHCQLRTLRNQVDVLALSTQQEKPSEGPDAAHLHASVSNLEKSLRRLEEELRRKLSSQQESQLSLIEKQRRNWEGTREKAEQMSQIFDSLIITNDRPYVSCGISGRLDSPGVVVFNQFELINKIEWEGEEGFCLMEPGVYLLQISGTVASASATVKLVSDQLEADLVSLSSPSSQLAFRSRSTIFTVEDDDRDAEKIIVELQDKDGSAVLEGDFCLLMYKISEVSSNESDAWKLVDE